MTFSELLEWLEYLRQEEKRDTKRDWYMAQIAAEVRRSLVENPNKVNTSDFLLRFKEAMEVTEEMAQQNSKSVWAAFLKVDVSK